MLNLPSVFRWFRRKPTHRPSRVPTRLLVEELERRFCMDGSLALSLHAEVLADHYVQLSGTATGEYASGVSVTFGGAVTGSTTTDWQGNFTFLTDAASLGAVYAFGIDQAENTSSAFGTIAVDAPVVHLNVVGTTTNSVTLFGALEGLDIAGRTVYISGAFSDTVVTDDEGTFLITAPVSASGNVEVYTVDAWGQNSSVAQEYVSLVPYITPGITLNVEVLSAHTVRLTGTLTDNDPVAQWVTFSGAVSGTTMTDTDGNFVFTTQAADLGTVYVTRYDEVEDITSTASTSVAVNAPVVSLSISALTHDTVTLTGTVSGLDAGGRAIVIAGVAEGTIIADANGAFTVTTTLTGTGTISAATTNLWGQSSNSAQQVVESLPSTSTQQITLHAQVTAGGYLTLSGQVIGGDVAGVTVTFSGAFAGSVMTDAYGNYSITTSAGAPGTVYAVGTNAEEESTNVASVIVARTPPTVTLAISDLGDEYVTFSGKLTALDYAYQFITVDGYTSGYIQTDAEGNFSFTKSRAEAEMVSVSVTDGWNQTSNTAQVNVPGPRPIIRDFRGSFVYGDRYVFQGRVEGVNTYGLMVRLGGIGPLSGVEAMVREDGTFAVMRRFPGYTGTYTATAEVTDRAGRTSPQSLSLVVFS